MVLGFSGTRKGMTSKQRDEFRSFLLEYKPREFHHGDCIGSDKDAHDLVREILPSCNIIIHPPEDARYRAYCEGVVLKPAPYLVRNRHIVNSASHVVATPAESYNVPRGSGTWMVIRYCSKIRRTLTILLPQ